jgi:hypothetical protein
MCTMACLVTPPRRPSSLDPKTDLHWQLKAKEDQDWDPVCLLVAGVEGMK